MKVDALVLAGALNNGELKEISSTPYEALISVSGKSMFRYVIAALKHNEYIERILVVGHKALEKELSSDVEFVEASESLAENIHRGTEYLNSSRKVLLVTSDIPLITSEAISDFLAKCVGSDAEICYPIVSKEANDKKYPGVARTYVKLKEGTFTGGNIILMTPEVISSSKAMIEKAIALRKKPWKLSWMLGLTFIIKFLLHKLTLSAIENRVKRIFGVKAKAVISQFPEIGIDIDKPSDWELAETILKKRVG